MDDLLEESEATTLEKTVPVLDDIQTPHLDIYLTPDTERTMFGYGFKRINEYLTDNAEHVIKSLVFKQDTWLTLDYNTPAVSQRIIALAIESRTNLYVMDEQIGWAGKEMYLQQSVQYDYGYQITQMHSLSSPMIRSKIPSVQVMHSELGSYLVY
eukprot:gene8153-9577_t